MALQEISVLQMPEARRQGTSRDQYSRTGSLETWESTRAGSFTMLLLQSITPAALGARQANQITPRPTGTLQPQLCSHHWQQIPPAALARNRSATADRPVGSASQQQKYAWAKKHQCRQRPPSPLSYVTSWPTQPAFAHSRQDKLSPLRRRSAIRSW